MSAQGFGFAAPQGGGGYKYVAQSAFYQTVYAGSTIASAVAGWTALPTGGTYWSTSDTRTFAGIAATGTTIAGATFYSSNNGASWSGTGTNYSFVEYNDIPAAGKNNNFAFDPITKNVASIYAAYVYKAGYYQYIAFKTPSAISYPYAQLVGTSVPAKWQQIIWWPLQGIYLATRNNSSYFFRVSSGGTNLGQYLLPSSLPLGTQRWCIEPSDGSLYFSSSNNIYQTSTSDLSSYTLLGTNSYTGNNQTVPIKGNGGYWYKGVGSGSSIIVYQSNTTSSPTGWVYAGTISLPGPTYGKMELTYDSTTGYMYCTTNTFDGYTVVWYTYRTTDPTSWASVWSINFMSIGINSAP